jgi:putative lipoprotein
MGTARRIRALTPTLTPTLTLALSLATAACGGGEPRADLPGAGADTAAGQSADAGGSDIEGPLAAAVDRPMRITGHVLIGTDRRDFQACAGGPEYWVDGPALPDLFELHEQITPGVEPYEAIFVDVLAEGRPAPASGAGAGLAGTIDVLEVRRAAFEGFGCRETEAGVVAAAGGNEPFWALQVRESGVTFSTPEGERSWSGAAPARSPEGWRIGGTTDAGTPFTLTLEVGGCSDSMSGAWSHLSAVLVAAEQRWEGCGWLGPAGE